MQERVDFKKYAEQVSSQMRWKKARPLIEREIETHLMDQQDAFIEKGLSREEAGRKSLEQMGDAVEIGAALDRVHRPKPAWGVIALTGILLFLGIIIDLFLLREGVMELSSSRLIAGTLIGIGCLLCAYFLDFSVPAKYAPAVFVGSAALAIVLALSSLRGAVHAASVLLLFPTAYSLLLYRLRDKKLKGLMMAFAALMLQVFCCLFVPSVFGAFMVLLCGSVLTAMACFRNWFGSGKKASLVTFAVFVSALAIACAVLVFLNRSLALRIAVAFDPAIDQNGAGWMTLRLREMLSGAKFIGAGPVGETSLWITEGGLTTGYIVTYLIHRLGWVSLAVIVAVFAAFFAFCIILCRKQKSELGRMASSAVVLTLLAQAAAYVTANLGFNLFASISLPLISYGNTATIVNMAIIGIMLSVFRTGSLFRDNQDTPKARIICCPLSISKEEGKIIISYK